jgi:signal transduction histidine kinase
MNAAQPPTSPDKRRAALTEAQWVTSESIRQVMSSVVNTQFLMFIAMTVMLALLYGHTSTAELLTWYAVNSFLSLFRLWFLRGYEQCDKTNNIDKRATYFQSYAKLAPLNGFIWGTSVYLFNGISAPNVAIFCLIIVLVFGMFSVSNLSSYLRLLNRFVWAYFAGLLGAILLHIAVAQNFSPDTVQLWYLTMSAIFVFMMFRVGARMNKTYIESLRLQFRNKQLISSLTAQKETALAAVATKNRMLASAAHDMRQPVLALDLYAGWLADEPSSSADIAPKISASTKAVIDLFDSMFDMSRLTEGQITTNLEFVNLKDLLDGLFLQYQPIAHSKNLTLRVRAVKGTVFTDFILLGRILGNLISNAIKYTQTGGVLVACRNTSSGIKIEVWDTGVGISEDQQPLVFKEFYKSPSNLGTTDGFGLGLAIVTQLSELLGCELSMKSRPGRGTVVAIQFSNPTTAQPADTDTKSISPLKAIHAV